VRIIVQHGNVKNSRADFLQFQAFKAKQKNIIIHKGEIGEWNFT